MRGVFTWLVLGLALHVSAADVLVREQITRPVYPHWADLGSAAFPFRTVYTDVLVAGQTNLIGGGGGGGGGSIVFTNTQTLTPGTPAYCVLYQGIAGVFQLGIPQGNAGADGATGSTGPAGPASTNTVTVQVFTNAILSSSQLITYQVTNRVWAASNYLARVSGLYRFTYYAGNDGGNPPQTYASELRGSYDGTTGWFVLTNGFQTTNTITVVSTNVVGGLGGATLYNMDHPELLGRTNSLFGQHLRFDDPLDAHDAATLGWVNGQIASAQNLFTSGQDTNGVYRLAYVRNQISILEIASRLAYIPIASLTLDGTQTNVVLSIATNNVTVDTSIDSNTNLIYFNNWTTFTNYTRATNAGLVSFTIPINFQLEAQFFRARGNSTNTATLNNAPLILNNGSNAVVSFAAQTNTPALTDFGSGKGGRFWVSNGLAYFTGSTNGTTVYTKLIAP